MCRSVRAVLVLALLAGVVLAEDPIAAYRDLFAEQETTVAGSAAKEDDVAFAAKLLASAKGVVDSPGFQSLLCEKAYRFGLEDPAGFRIAIEAAEILARLRPDEIEAFQAKRLDAYRRLYRRSEDARKVPNGEEYLHETILLADERMAAEAWLEAQKLMRKALVLAAQLDSARRVEVRDRIRRISARLRAQAKVDDLIVALSEDPGDEAGRERLIRLLVVSIDDPAEAVNHLSPTTDEAWRRFVPLAARDPAKISEVACLDLAEWYLSLAAGAEPVPARMMLGRADAYLQVFLARHKKEDEMRLRARLDLERLAAAVWRLDARAISRASPERWVDLVRVTDPTRGSVEGRWRREGGVLTGSRSKGTLFRFPVSLTGGYEIETFFLHRHGDGPHVLLPVGEAGVVLDVAAWENKATALTHIDRRGGERIPTVLQDDARYRLRIRVKLDGKAVTITSELNGKKLLSWRGRQSSLSHGYLESDLRPGLRTYHGDMTFYSVKVRTLSGEAKLLPLKAD